MNTPTMKPRPTSLDELVMAARNWNHSIVGDGPAQFRLSEAIQNYRPETLARQAHDAIAEMMIRSGAGWDEVVADIRDMAELGLLDKIAES